MDLETKILIAVLLPLLAGPVLACFGGALGRRGAWLGATVALVSAALLGLAAAEVPPAGRVVIEWPWAPSLGVSLRFLVDGLSLFFGLVVSGVGVLVCIYSADYFRDGEPRLGRFFGTLLVFMGAMLGTVFAANLVLLYIFWELTGLASFLLIGFSHAKEESRRGARMALLVTGATGLAMLLGLVLLGEAGGTYQLDALLATPASAHPWLTAGLVLTLAGAFGKSAQFPLFFWLPNAMAAPTPVSAYLHSATMVKLGVFLCARLFPGYSTVEVWAPLLTVVGLLTMVWCAWLALTAFDLKAILAYSTVSQLGLLVGLYGFGARTGLSFDFFQILNHTLYKGALFMLVGVIDHSTGLRDVRQLGGLWKKAPALGAIFFVAVAAMIGLPLTSGFVSKELLLKLAWSGAETTAGWWVLGALTVAAVYKVAFSLRLFLHVFAGAPPPAVEAHFHAPAPRFLLAPALLAGGAVVLGIAPQVLEPLLARWQVAGLQSDTGASLAAFYGFDKVLLHSAGLLIAGALLYVALGGRAWRLGAAPDWLRFDAFFERALAGLSVAAKAITRALQSDRPLAFPGIVLSFVVLLVGPALWWRGWPEQHTAIAAALSSLAAWAPLRVMTALLICVGALLAVFARRWTAQLISVTSVGFLITYYYYLFHAPDPALTQILVETATLVMLVILLGRFPRSAEEGERADRRFSARQLFNATVALAFGAMMTGLMLVMTARPATPRVGEFHLARTRDLARGDNAVNTILVDFRGFDTLGEITVLVVAMLGCLGLFVRYKRSRAELEEGPMAQPGFGIRETPEDRA